MYDSLYKTPMKTNFNLICVIYKIAKQRINVYMGCSDVSEFEHIYGQILMTPSCVYGRLFT